jgi:hypothetical protein
MLHVHRGEPVSHTLVDPRQSASDARMPTICVASGCYVGASRARLEHPEYSRLYMLSSPLRADFAPDRSPRSLEVRESPDSGRLVTYIESPAACCRFRVRLLHAAAPVVCCIL